MATSIYEIKNQTQIEYQDNNGNKGARAIVNIYAKSNESLNLLFYWKDGKGFSKDLSGYQAAMSIRERKDGQVVAATCSSEPGYDGTISLGNDGSIAITMPAKVLQDALYKNGTWLYDIILKSESGIITRLIQGTFYIDRSVTQLKDLETV